MLIGNAGLGKTHAALAIAGLVLEQGHDVIYVSSPDFFGKIEASRFDPSGDADTLLRTASTADLLIPDDLGTEFVTPYFITVFYSLLNNRLGAGLPTIITTNITDGALLEKRYTEKFPAACRRSFPSASWVRTSALRKRRNKPQKDPRRAQLPPAGIFDVIPFCSQNSGPGSPHLRRCACIDAVFVRHHARCAQRIEHRLQGKCRSVVLLRRWHRAKRLHPS